MKNYVVVPNEGMGNKRFVYHRARERKVGWSTYFGAYCDHYLRGDKILLEHVRHIPGARPCKRCKWED